MTRARRPKIVHEDQASISAWADGAFGSCQLPAAIRRTREEISEFLFETASHRSTLFSDRVLSEGADIVICLYRLAQVLGADLQEEIDRKMVLNRSRRWRRLGDGTGRHLREGETL